jgi:hydrogenase nickel incorporation protein HypA/HybF
LYEPIVIDFGQGAAGCGLYSGINGSARAAKMHEISVCRALLAQVEEAARAYPAYAIAQIVVEIGPLSGIEPALLVSAFAAASHGGRAAGAELSVEATAVKLRCAECGAESAGTVNRLLCAGCGGCRTTVIGGDELRLLRVEMASADE